MYLVTISYGKPDDPMAFDDHYKSVHLPLAKQIPGVEGFAAGKCETLDGSEPASYFLANITFPSKEAAVAALTSPEGQAAAADIATFATGGVAMAFTSAETPLL